MTALQDISAAVTEAKALQQGRPALKRKRLIIRIGDSAARAVRAETQDRQLPHMIGGVRVSLTSAFRGWEIQEL